MSWQPHRPRGILTSNDRALLEGEIEYEHRQQYSNRYDDIRTRIANGLLDFSVIRACLRDRDRKRIFRDPAQESEVANAPFIESIRELFYWTYFGLKEQNYNIEKLLIEAIEDAEEDFLLTYWGESVDADVQIDINIEQSDDIDDLIAAIENGEAVKAGRLYNLLELSSGVPIDLSEVDTVRVWFQSHYPEGEKAVLETMFTDYLGKDVEIKGATDRITSGELGLETRNAVVDPNRSLPDPSEIKNYRSPTGFNSEPNEETIAEIRRQEESEKTLDEDDAQNANESIIGGVIDEMMEQAEPTPPTIDDIIEERKEFEERHGPVTPKAIIALLEQIQDQFVSTIEIGAALDCAPEAARQILKELLDQQRVRTRSVTDTSGNHLSIWWLANE